MNFPSDVAHIFWRKFFCFRLPLVKWFFRDKNEPHWLRMVLQNYTTGSVNSCDSVALEFHAIPVQNTSTTICLIQYQILHITYVKSLCMSQIITRYILLSGSTAVQQLDFTFKSNSNEEIKIQRLKTSVRSNKGKEERICRRGEKKLKNLVW